MVITVASFLGAMAVTTYASGKIATAPVGLSTQQSTVVIYRNTPTETSTPTETATVLLPTSTPIPTKSPTPTTHTTNNQSAPAIINHKSSLTIPDTTIGHIEVSIADQKTSIYDINGELLFTSLVVTGKKGFATPKGELQITWKNDHWYMQGCAPNNAKDCWKVWTNYASFFDGDGDAFHDAPHRSVFGPKANYVTSGSRGCVNMPTQAAYYIYRNAPNGTKVRIY